jgi:threonine dehydratase
VLRERLPRTRLVRADSLSRRAGVDVYLKLETEMPTGSFKVRGAIYALAKRLGQGPVAAVAAASTGNHGAAVAYAAQAFGIPARIFVPERPNEVKAARIERLGATLVKGGADITAARAQAEAFASSMPDVYLLDDATDPWLPAGPATIGVEILEDLPSVRHVYVPMGDTALIRGIGSAATAVPNPPQVVGVQAERAPAYFLSWTRGAVVETETCDTIADGLATRTPAAANVQAIRHLVAAVLLVSEEQMLAAVAHLAIEEHVIAEPSGAAPVAALMAHDTVHEGPVALVVSGANVTPQILRRALT